MRILVCLVALACLTATAATAATVNLTMDNLIANGWKATATSVYGGTTNATVTMSSDYSSSSFRFYTGPMPVSWQFQWAGVSTDSLAGTMLSAITSLKIKNFGAYGDGPNWQPPTFSLVVDKGDVGGNQRCITWMPWSDGNPRAPLAWNEYDAATTGTWHVYETGMNFSSLAALKAELPNAYFEYTAQLPISWGYASQQAFNVGNCPLYDEDRGYFNGAAGYVDWFEVGVNGNVTRYDLGVVPEPSSLFALLFGAAGLAGIIRRRK